MKVERPPRRFCLSYAVLNLSTSSFIELHETGSHIYVRTPYVKFCGKILLTSTTSCKVGSLPWIKSLILKLSRWINSILKIWIWTVFTPQLQNIRHDEAIWLWTVRPELKILCCIQKLLVHQKPYTWSYITRWLPWWAVTELQFTTRSYLEHFVMVAK